MTIKIITEIASTHNGDIKVVDYLINEHIKSKSNYIKFQIFKADELVDKKNKNFKEFKKIEISYKHWEKIIKKYCKKTKIILEIFDISSFKFCKRFKKSVDIKISTTETDNLLLIKEALKNFKKVFINVSGYEKEYINLIIKKFVNKRTKNQIIFLYGFQGFPSKPNDLRFALFDFFHKKKLTYGYSDHSLKGFSKDLMKILPLVIKKKIFYYEKHVCKNISLKPPDHISSMEFRDFKKLINIIRIMEITKIKTLGNLNNKRVKLSNAEKKYSNKMHKFAFSKTSLKKGIEVQPSDLIFLRTSKKNGLKRENFYFRRIFTKKSIDQNTFLKKEHLNI